MRTNYTIKNFRVFDQDGAHVGITPITILTGCNSSGKSSIVKSIFLLDSFLKQVKYTLENKESIKLNQYKFDFTTYPNNLLGRYDRVVNSNSDSDVVTVEYSVYSKMMSCNLDVRMEFCSDKNDELNNAYLKSWTVLKDGHIIYSSGKGEKTVYNLNAIKDEFYSFVETEFIVHNYCGLEGEYEFEGKVSKEEYENQIKLMIDYLRSVDKNRRSDIFNYVRMSNEKNSLALENKFDLGLLEWTKENDSLFNIPIIDWLNTLTKGEIRDKLLELLVSLDNAEAVATNKVLAEYLSSDYNGFGEYFKAKEYEYLDNVIHMKFPMKDTPSIPSVKGMEIDQMYMVMDPHNSCKIISWDEVVISEDERKSQKQHDIEIWENTKVSFDILYETVMFWNSKYTKEGSAYYSYISNDYEPEGKYTHHTYSLLCKFARRLINEILLPDWAGNMSYVSSSRVEVSRLYTLDGKDDFTNLLRNYFEKHRLFFERQERGGGDVPKYEPNSFINKWIKEFGVGESISLHIDEEGLGVQIRLHKNSDDKGRLLADEGYGITQLVSILLQIETAILSAQGVKVNRYFRLENLDGYNTDEFHYEVNTIAIEEPEIHLHPRMQSLLADMLVEAYEKYNIHFIIETHSEYLIRRSQLLVSKMGYKNNEESVEKSPFITYYIPKDAKPYSLGYRKDGKFMESFGTGFYDEASNLAFELL